jgi:hypothetical protein
MTIAIETARIVDSGCDRSKPNIGLNFCWIPFSIPPAIRVAIDSDSTGMIPASRDRLESQTSGYLSCRRLGSANRAVSYLTKLV